MQVLPVRIGMVQKESGVVAIATTMLLAHPIAILKNLWHFKSQKGLIFMQCDTGELKNFWSISNLIVILTLLFPV